MIFAEYIVFECYPQLSPPLQQPLVISVTRKRMNRITTDVIRIGSTSTKVEAKFAPIIKPVANKIITARKASAKLYS